MSTLTGDLIYRQPIEEDIPRRHFQQCARERMNIYRLMDPYRDRFDEDSLISLKKDQSTLTEEARNLFIQLYNPWAMSTTMDIKKRDNMSHYICRLMFCLTPENKENFISYETMIFKCKLFEKNKKNIRQQQIFQMLSNLTRGESYEVGQIVQIEEEQFQQYKRELFASTDSFLRFPDKPPIKDQKFQKWQPKNFFKVPMEFCEYLISRRDCFIHKGSAYLQGELFLKILPKMYSKYLRLAMDELTNVAERILSEDQDNQFRQFIRCQPSLMFSQNVSFQELKEGINLKNISVFSKRSFPPCMIQMYDTLVTKKHLKHEARLQLILFLKLAGLSSKQNQLLWKQNYTKGVSDSQVKQVQYAVRHSYGEQGKKANYGAKDCFKIINSKPTSGQYHGCPFKYYGHDQLNKFLRAKYPNINQATLDTIQQKKGKNQFEVACRSLFESTHPDPKGKHLNLSKGVGRHPNGYFYQSEKYYEQFAE